MTRRTWLVVAIALLAACGGDDDDASSSSTPSATVTAGDATTVPHTTVPESRATLPADTSMMTTTIPGVATTSATDCSEPPAFDLEGPLREQFVGYLMTCGFTRSEAACLFDHLDFDDPAVVAGEPDSMLPAFEACRIDVDRMAEIGGS
jgi:hypothetical protein